MLFSLSYGVPVMLVVFFVMRWAGLMQAFGIVEATAGSANVTAAGRR